MLNFNTGILSAANNLASNQNNQSLSGDPVKDFISNQTKQDWNDFLSWLDKKGVRGKAELDKNNLGNKYFAQYIKENPKTTLSESIIPNIRKQFLFERDAAIEDMKAGKSYYNSPKGMVSGKDADYSSFLRFIVENEKSENPNYVGQRLTMTPFKGAILKDETGRVIAEDKFHSLLKPGASTQIEDLHKRSKIKN